MKTITIIGGGASGTLLTANLLKHAVDQPLRINLVEKKDRIGRGVAYSTVNDSHLLNVPANKMGAFPQEIDHFYKWLNAKNHFYHADDFVPRKLFGEYLRDVLCETARAKGSEINLTLLDDEAVDILTDEARAQVILNSGEILYSDKVVLGFGNFPPPHPKAEDQLFTSFPKYFQNPWDAKTFESISSTDDILIIGTGLTMVDAAMSFYHAGHRGKIFALSTRGLLPAAHELGFVYPSFIDELQSVSKFSELSKIVRRHCANADSQNSNWRGVIDSLRPHTQEIWLNLSETDKRRFMQHLSRYWNVARHRMPPEAARILDEMRANGQLQVLKGRLLRLNSDEGGRLEVSYSSEGAKNQLSVDALINCIGSESNFNKIDSPLIKNLLAKGSIKSDPLKLGIEALPDGRVVDDLGNTSDKIYALGTALKSVLWESTAIPEIRTQANKLALSLLI